MKQKFSTKLTIPEGVECSVVDRTLECKKGERSFIKKIEIPSANLKVEGNLIELSCEEANRKDIKFIFSLLAHLKNGMKGLQEDFVYKLEICHVHFPMTVKLEENKLIINNFLGEKKSRFAKVVEGVNIKIEGKDLIVSGQDIEKVGQTAANIEKATKVRSKDRRIFQDGIFIVEKPRGAL